MKKLLLAVAAFGMLLTSCAKDDAVAPVVEKEAFVSFCVNAPAVATRYGEGQQATKLQWAVYETTLDASGAVTAVNHLEELDGNTTFQISTTVNFDLIQGRSYEVLFWAADEDAPYDLNTATRTMTVEYGDDFFANQESYDAFYKYESLGTVNGAMSKTIELTRPFAQLNIATADTKAATAAELTVKKTAVKVTNIFSTLNLATGEVSGETAATFALANRAEGTITVDKVDYDQIAMNYLLVGAKKLVDVELTINDEGLTRSYSSVPVQRNYRTNIIGNILTSAADFTVTILHGFAGADEIYNAPEHVATLEQLEKAMEKGKRSFILDADITTDKSCTLINSTTTRSEQSDVTIDLNGKTFEITNPKNRLNIGDKDNKTKPNVTIKNGNLNCKVYALSGSLELKDIVFGGTIEYAGDSQGVISTKHATLLAERCNMKNVKKSGTTKPRSICTEGRSSGYLILRDCDFRNSNLDRAYINPLNGSATLELTNCSLYNLASNIDIGASLVWTNKNLNLTGCTGGFTFTISRASTSLTEAELAVYKSIKANNKGSMRFLFTDGEKNNL